MEMNRIPRPGQIYNHFKNKPYQIITLATHAETHEEMVVYQALYGDFKCYIRALENFLSKVDHVKYPQVSQKYRFELRVVNEIVESGKVESTEIKPDAKKEEVIKQENIKQENIKSDEIQKEAVIKDDIACEAVIKEAPIKDTDINEAPAEGKVNSVLMLFLDAESYYKKLEVITSNRKHMNDRLINDMSVSLDCAIDEGPLDQRIQGLVYCLQALCRFEDKRLR